MPRDLNIKLLIHTIQAVTMVQLLVHFLYIQSHFLLRKHIKGQIIKFIIKVNILNPEYFKVFRKAILTVPNLYVNYYGMWVCNVCIIDNNTNYDFGYRIECDG